MAGKPPSLPKKTTGQAGTVRGGGAGPKVMNGKTTAAPKPSSKGAKFGGAKLGNRV